MQRVRAAKQTPTLAPALSPRARSAFEARLHWHCHFIQKLEAEPALETISFNRALDRLRPRGLAKPSKSGCGGKPVGPSWMRPCAHFSTGVGSTSACGPCSCPWPHTPWLDWRDLNQPLARQFIDYEPGIHISQLQMQSGVTGINALRIYNPVLQGQRLDPEGLLHSHSLSLSLLPCAMTRFTSPGCYRLGAWRKRGAPARPGAPGAHGSSSLSPAPRGRSPGRPQCPRPHGDAQRQEASRQESRRVLIAHGSREKLGGKIPAPN